MVVFIAVKALPTILKSYSNATIENICIMVYARIVLSWLLSKSPKTKNLIVKNWLKDIQDIKDHFENDHKQG